MSEELAPDTPESPPELSPIEAQAAEMGWKPKDQYEGDPNKWVNADIFVARAPLFEKIDEQHKYNKNLQKRLEQLEKTLQDQAAHTELVRKTEYKRALEALKQEKRIALAEEDHLRAEDIQEKIDEVKEAQKEVVAAPQPVNVETPQAFTQWAAENQWYKLDQEMREFADAVGIVEHGKGKSPEEVLKAVTEKVRKQFKDSPHFRNPMKDQAPAVESRGTVGTPKKGSTFKPTPEQKAIAQRFAATGVMTEEQYYKDLQAMDENE